MDPETLRILRAAINPRQVIITSRSDTTVDYWNTQALLQERKHGRLQSDHPAWDELKKLYPVERN